MDNEYTFLPHSNTARRPGGSDEEGGDEGGDAGRNADAQLGRGLLLRQRGQAIGRRGRRSRPRGLPTADLALGSDMPGARGGALPRALTSFCGTIAQLYVAVSAGLRVARCLARFRAFRNAAVASSLPLDAALHDVRGWQPCLQCELRSPPHVGDLDAAAGRLRGAPFRSSPRADL